MMMQYRHRNRERSAALPIVIAVGVCILFFAIDFFVGNRMSGMLRSAAAPAIASVRTALIPQSLTNFFVDRKALIQENSRLQENQSALEGRLSVALARITDLELQLGTSIVPTSERKIAHIGRVISYVQYPFGELTVLFTDDLFTPQPKSFVFTREGAVVGTVLQSEGRTSLITLMSKSGAKYTMRIGEDTIVDVYGKGGVTLFAEVPKNALMSVGDIVTLPEAEGAPVGVVGEITTNETDIVKHVLIRLIANPLSLSFVAAYE